MKKKIAIILSFLIIAIIGLGFAGYYVYENEVNIDTIYPGISIEEFNIGGMTSSDALKYIKEAREDELSEKEMKLYYEDYIYEIGLKDLAYSYDYNIAVEKAYALGREGSLFQRYKKVKDIKEKGREISLKADYQVEKIAGIVEEVSEDLYRESKNATFDFNGGNIIIEEETLGRKVDSESLSKAIKENIDELKDIEINLVVLEPQYTKEYYSKINGVLGQYSTAYGNSGIGRKKNIALSASSLNGKLLHSGESMSYNQVTGPRQREAGYEEAPVIMNGELTPGVGGGVCQTSTTLYNAVLLADLTVLERHPHSIPPAYINKGQDAAVAGTYLDLKFRNDFDFPIYISSWVSGDQVYFSIYGDKANRDYTVSIKPEIIESIPYQVKEDEDLNLPAGTKELQEQGRNGYKVKTYKSIIKNGAVQETKQITTDYYKEKDFIYKVGPPGAPKPEEAKPTESEEAKPVDGEEKPTEKEPEVKEPVVENPVEP